MYGDTGILVQWGFNDHGSDDHYIPVVCWPADCVAVADVVLHRQGCRGRKPAVCIQSAAKLDSAAQQSASIAAECCDEGDGEGDEVMPKDA